jgi:hypothetical protein
MNNLNELTTAIKNSNNLIEVNDNINKMLSWLDLELKNFKEEALVKTDSLKEKAFIVNSLIYINSFATLTLLDLSKKLRCGNCWKTVDKNSFIEEFNKGFNDRLTGYKYPESFPKQELVGLLKEINLF